VTAILILAWAFGLVAIVAVGRYITSLGEDIDAPVPLALSWRAFTSRSVSMPTGSGGASTGR
jgi:hypothetical protein